MIRLLTVLYLIFILRGIALSQCCSPGNPVGGTTNIGILNKKTFRITTFYRHSVSEGYWQGTQKAKYTLIRDAKFNYIGTMLGYGLLNKLTAEIEAGYFISKTQTYNTDPPLTNKGYGINNAVLSLKYNVIGKTEKSFEWTLGSGAKIPFTRKYLMVNNVELPIDVQPSTHAFGIVLQSFLYKGFLQKRLQFFLINRFENNFSDIKRYQFGDALYSSLFVTKQLGTSNWTVILQARHEWRDRDLVNASVLYPTFLSKGTQRVISSGGNLIFIAPQINYTIAQKWNISLVTDFPVYRNYNGAQLGNKFAFALYLSRDFWTNRCAVKN